MRLFKMKITHLRMLSNMRPSTKKELTKLLIQDSKIALTLRSSSNAMIGASTALSVNSGNSLRLYRNVERSDANNLSCCGKSSRSSLSSSMRPARFDRLPRSNGAARNLVTLRLGNLLFPTKDSLCKRRTLRGYKSAAFSRKRKEIWARRSRSWNTDARMATELPSCRAALTQVRSWSPKGEGGTS
jgi:hypothetical protein